MNIAKELEEHPTVLLLVSGVEYNDTILNVVKELSGKKVCYVTLNKTFDSLKELFEKNKANVENIVFIDAISKTFKKVPDQTEGCHYVSSPGALTELSIAISKMLKHGFNYLIFDSLTNLLIYQKKVPLAKFVSSIANNIKEHKTKAVFYALSVKEQESLIKEAGMFVDKVIDLGAAKK